MRPWLYSTLYRLGVAPWDSELRPELVEMVEAGQIPAPSSGTVVDLGCGTGREAVYLADRIVVMTSSPGRVKDVFTIKLPEARDRFAAEFTRYESEITRVVKEEVAKVRE